MAFVRKDGSVRPARRLFQRVLLAFVVAAGQFPPMSAVAGGVLGDLVDRLAPGVGTALDDVHRGIKDALPVYKTIEEGSTGLVREGFVQSGAPLLQELIARSRDDALSAGVQPVPPGIRENLAGYVSVELLDRVRFRVGGGGDLTLQVNAMRYGDAVAIALDDVIVFRQLDDALYNPSLWVHELAHVDQYQRWGLRDFSIRYLRDHAAIEQEAYDAQARYTAWVASRNAERQASLDQAEAAATLNPPVAAPGMPRRSNVCGTAFGACQVDGSASVGTPCWCNTLRGAVFGSLVPAGSANVDTSVVPASPVPTLAGALPSGWIMQGCGCWGSSTTAGLSIYVGDGAPSGIAWRAAGGVASSVTTPGSPPGWAGSASERTRAAAGALPAR